MSRRINVRAVVVRGNKILAVKHKALDGTESPYWALPGGGLDPMESLHDGVKREVFEELGVQAEVGKMLFAQQFQSQRSDMDEELEFHFLVKDSPAFDALDLASTSHGLEELARVEFVDPKKVLIMPLFLSELDIVDYAENERAPYVYNDLLQA